MATLYLVRHGQTTFNLEKRLQGRQDSPLTPLGVEQAKALALQLSKTPFVACYSSPQSRALTTAQLILANHTCPIHQEVGLCEMSFGDFDGQLIADINQHHQYQLLHNDFLNYTAIDNRGESANAFYERVKHTFERITSQHPTGNILVVSHGMVLTLYTALCKGLSWWQFLDSDKHQFLQNCQIAMIDTTKPNLD